MWRKIENFYRDNDIEVKVTCVFCGAVASVLALLWVAASLSP